MKRRSIFQPLKKGGNPFLPLKEELQAIKWENEQLGLIFQDVEADQWMGDDGPYILTPVSPQGQLEAFLINTGARISVLTQDAKKQGMRSIWQTAEASSMNCTSVVCKIAKGSLWLPNVRHMAIAHFTIKDHYENILGFCFKWTNLAHGDRHCMFLQLRQKEGICFMATTHSPCTTWHKNYSHSIQSVVAWTRISEITAGVEKRQSSSEPLPVISPVWPFWSPRWLSNWQYSPTNSCCAKNCKLSIYLASSWTPLDGQGAVQKSLEGVG